MVNGYFRLWRFLIRFFRFFETVRGSPRPALRPSSDVEEGGDAEGNVISEGGDVGGNVSGNGIDGVIGTSEGLDAVSNTADGGKGNVTSEGNIGGATKGLDEELWSSNS